MPYRLFWADEDKRVLVQEFTDSSSGDDVLTVATQSAQMMGTVSHNVYLIIDRRNAPHHILSPRQMNTLENLVPANQDLVVTVGVKRYVINTNATMGELVAPKAFSGSIYVETMQDAARVLQEQRGIVLSLPLEDAHPDESTPE